VVSAIPGAESSSDEKWISTLPAFHKLTEHLLFKRLVMNLRHKTRPRDSFEREHQSTDSISEKHLRQRRSCLLQDLFGSLY
jgi:hypothetical protein